MNQKNRATLQAIREFVEEHHIPPSVRDLMPLVGIRSTSAMAYRLDRLAERGYIRRVPGVSRGIIVLPKEAIEGGVL